MQHPSRSSVAPHLLPGRAPSDTRPARAGTLWAALLAVASAAAACDRAATTAPVPSAAAPSASRGGDPGAARAGGLPARYVLPGGAPFPEASAYDPTTDLLYVSSATTGTISRGDVRDSALAVFLPGGADGRTGAGGLAVDPLRQRLFVAGGTTGHVWVYDSRSGALRANLAPGAAGASFINDVAVAPDGSAYLTDSQNPVIYRVVAAGAGGFRVERWLDLTNTVVHYQAGAAPNLNGVVATPDGRYLFVVQTNTGQLFRVDVGARTVAEVDLGGEHLPGGDGLFLRGATLYAAQNQQGVIAEVRLEGFGPGSPRGRVVARLADPSFHFPTAVREVRGRLLVVNSQFDRLQAGLAPTTPFSVSVVRPPHGGPADAPGASDTTLDLARLSTRERQVYDLLRSIETGDPAPSAVVSPTLIQHNLDLADGLASFGAFLTSVPAGTARAQPVRVMEAGNYVIAHTNYDLFGPKVGFDIFRYDNGRIVEHWDNLQAAAGPNLSGHTMLDGAVAVRDPHRTAANKALVLAFTNEVLIAGRTDHLERYFDGDRYVQHNPQLSDGVPALRAFIQSLAAQGRALRDARVDAVFGDGNFVLVVHEGTLPGGQTLASYDLFRVEGGRIAEHWDVLQTVPPRDQWKNANGKFGFPRDALTLGAR